MSKIELEIETDVALFAASNLNADIYIHKVSFKPYIKLVSPSGERILFVEISRVEKIE